MSRDSGKDIRMTPAGAVTGSAEGVFYSKAKTAAQAFLGVQDILDEESDIKDNSYIDLMGNFNPINNRDTSNLFF